MGRCEAFVVSMKFPSCQSSARMGRFEGTDTRHLDRSKNNRSRAPLVTTGQGTLRRDCIPLRGCASLRRITHPPRIAQIPSTRSASRQCCPGRLLSGSCARTSRHSRSFLRGILAVAYQRLRQPLSLRLPAEAAITARHIFVRSI